MSAAPLITLAALAVNFFDILYRTFLLIVRLMTTLYYCTFFEADILFVDAYCRKIERILTNRLLCDRIKCKTVFWEMFV